MYENPLLLIGAIFAVAAIYVFFPIVFMVYQRFGPRIALRCPEIDILTSTQVSTGRAMWSSMFGAPKLRIKDCARWPERANCGQACLKDGAEFSNPVTIYQSPNERFL